MRGFVAPLLVLAVLSTGSGCGDLSQEDLLFLAAVPGRANIEVNPAGVKSRANEDGEGQALTATQGVDEECADGDLKCTATNIARGFNTLTFGILDGIDFVLRQPPTTRAPNRRVWGPYFDVEKGTTFRFEMNRAEDGATFGFCMHFKVGAVKIGTAADVTCETDRDDDSKLINILDGQFTPGKSEAHGARTGVGSMTLHADRVAEALPFGRTAVINFDNDDNERNVAVTLTDVNVGGGSSETRDVDYAFHRGNAGDGTFYFRVFAELVQPLIGTGPEEIAIAAKWHADQSGRADARIEGGDIPDETAAEAAGTQCWTKDLEDTYFDPVGKPANETVGDVTTCSFAENVLDEIAPD